MLSKFINKLFNNLNWTISELEVAMRNVRALWQGLTDLYTDVDATFFATVYTINTKYLCVRRRNPTTPTQMWHYVRPFC